MILRIKDDERSDDFEDEMMTTPHPIPMLQFKSEMVEKKKKLKRFCPRCKRYWVYPSGILVNTIHSMIFMTEDVEEADVFEGDVQMFEFLLRRLFQVRNLLVEDDLSERRGKWRSPTAPILLLHIHVSRGAGT